MEPVFGKFVEGGVSSLESGAALRLVQLSVSARFGAASWMRVTATSRSSWISVWLVQLFGWCSSQYRRGLVQRMGFGFGEDGAALGYSDSVKLVTVSTLSGVLFAAYWVSR